MKVGLVITMMLVGLHGVVGAVRGAGGSGEDDGGGKPRARPAGPPSKHQKMKEKGLPGDSRGAPSVAAAAAPGTAPPGGALFNMEPLPFLRNHARDADGKLEVHSFENVMDREMDDGAHHSKGWMREMVERGLDERFLDLAEAMNPKSLVHFGHQNLAVELERRTKQALANVAPLVDSRVSEVEKALAGLDVGVLTALLARVREAFTKMCEASITALSQRFQDETRAEFEDLFAVWCAVGCGGMVWHESKDKKKKDKVKTETGKPFAKKRRLITSREGNDHAAKHQRKDGGDGSGDGAGDESGGIGGNGGGIAN